MSGLDEGLLGPTITKKRVIAILLVTIILVAAFAYSVMIYSWLFGSPRKSPNERLEGAPEEDALLILPESGYNWSELAENLDLDDPDLLDQLRDLHDGNIDLLDLLQYASLAAALAGSDIEVFRVYNIPSYEEVSEKLWKFECFDEFLGDSWECNVPLQNYDFYSYSDYYSKHSGLNIYNISMPLSPGLGSNSFMIPNLFPNPYIMENSIELPNITPGSEVLRKNAFNSTTLTLDFTSENPVNMTYELFGLALPTNTEINNSALDEDYTPTIIKDRYLQLPPDISTYLDFNVHPNINFHYNNLRTIINDEDTSFVVANKIRNYLQENFTFGYNALENSPPADGEDLVEWFCFHEEGIWTHFASAFCVFCRAFGVACRFVDGYNSRYADTVYDPVMGDGIAVKYRNLYNWAEVYIPTDVSGNGKWVQMDMLYDSFGGGSGVGPILSNYNLTLSSNFTSGPRGSIAQLNATLSSSYNLSVADKNIQFYDYTMDESLGSNTTDSNGVATFTFPIDDNQTVGPHIIYASYGGTANLTFYIVDGDIQVSLTSVSPPQVNISQDPYTTISGIVTDPVNGKPVKNAIFNLILYQKGTNNIVNPSFSPPSATANDNGVFSQIVNIDSSVPYGQYEVRADFNGSWANPLSPSFPFTYPFISNYSNRLDLNVTKELTYSLWFYINDVPSNNYYSPNVLRASTLELKAQLFNESMQPAIGYSVQFYDYTTNSLIGSNITDFNGITTFSYPLGNGNPAGPNLLYASFGSQINYSYYILTDIFSFTQLSGPNPLEINSSGSGVNQFSVSGYLNDSVGNPIGFSEVYLRIFRSGFDYSSYLVPNQAYPYTVDESGYFDLSFGVTSDIPSGNYTLQIQFDGDYNLYADISNPDPYYFNLGSLSTSSPFSDELKITNPGEITVYLSVENKPTATFYNDWYQPEKYTSNDTANFQINVTQGGTTPTGTITLYDVYGGYTLATHPFVPIENGSVELSFSANQFYYSGLHKIRAQYDDGSFSGLNYTFIVMNENPVDFTQISLSDSQIVRDSTLFDLSGHIEENGYDLRALEVRLTLLDSNLQNFSQYLSGNVIDFSSQDGSFNYNNILISQNCPKGTYYLKIDFNGNIYLPEVPGVDVSNFMINTNSSLIPVNVLAGTQTVNSQISTEYDVSGIWLDGDTLYVSGNLVWDNNTGIEGANLIIEVRDLFGSLITSNNLVSTGTNGFFNGSLAVDDTWPDYWTETVITIKFEPSVFPNNFQYVEGTTEEI